MTAHALLLPAAALTAGLAAVGFVWFFLTVFRESAHNYARTMGEEASRELEDSFLFVSPERIAEMGRLAAVAAFCLFFIPLLSLTRLMPTLAGILLGALAAAFAFTLPRRYVHLLKTRRRITFETQLVEALGTMSNALRAGFSINQAFESVVTTGENPIRQEFQVLLQQLRVGMPFDEALTALETRVGSEDLTLVVTAIDIARKTGGNLTEIFDRIAETIRARARIQSRVRTLTAQGRLQGIVVSFMPLVLGVAMAILKPGIMMPFILSAKGAIALGVALALIAGGWLIIRRIIRIDV